MSKSWDTFLSWEASNHDLLVVKLCYLDMARDINAGIMLSEILYWHLPDRTGLRNKLRIEKEGHMWIARTHEQWFERTRLSRYQVDQSIKKLEALELIESKLFKFNNAPTKHIRIKEENFIKRFKEVVDVSFDTREHWKGENGFARMSQNENETDPENPNCEKLANGIARNSQMELRETRNSLTETTTNTTTETTFSEPASPLGESTALTVIGNDSNVGLGKTTDFTYNDFGEFEIFKDEEMNKFFQLIPTIDNKGKSKIVRRYLTKPETRQFATGHLEKKLLKKKKAKESGASHRGLMELISSYIGIDGKSLPSEIAPREASGAERIMVLIGDDVLTMENVPEILNYIKNYKPHMNVSLTSVASFAVEYMSRKRASKDGIVPAPGFKTTQEKNDEIRKNRDYKKIAEEVSDGVDKWRIKNFE